jgi:signal transduction histidine kinase
MGMDAATKRDAFNPFFTTKTVGQHTGLGLPVVFGIVKQSGGWISMESHLDRGTCVEIYLREIPAPVSPSSV